MTNHQRYQEALDYIYSFVDYSVKRTFRYSEDVLDLDRVRRLLQALGDPQAQCQSVHIAGTKGKGSVAALMASALKAQGYRTGLYTSPHLVHLTERIKVDGQDIGEETLAEAVDTVRAHVDSIDGLTTYEIITAVGFLHFANQGVECAVVEVGLGGRLDATNVLSPLVSVITSLSYDHMHILGDSLSDIAREKAGIIKPGVPVVLAPQQYEAELVVEQVAKDESARLIRVGKEWLFAPGARDLDHQDMYIWSASEQPSVEAFIEAAGNEEWVPPRYSIPLLGYHQVINAAVAYAALQVVDERGLPIAESAILEGFRTAFWPGRFQVLSKSPAVVVDSAHNRDSALKLRIAIDDYFPGKPVTLVFGASADKDIAGMLAELMPRVSRLVVTKAAHPRAADPKEVAALAQGHGVRTTVACPVANALEMAMSRARPGEVIVAAGSLFVAGEVLAAWEENGERQVKALGRG
jgi:dihydrofolate synthase/folylpolyglutamate synthase